MTSDWLTIGPMNAGQTHMVHTPLLWLQARHAWDLRRQVLTAINFIVRLPFFLRSSWDNVVLCCQTYKALIGTCIVVVKMSWFDLDWILVVSSGLRFSYSSKQPREMAVILQPQFDNDTQNSFHSVVVEKLVLWLWSQIEELQLYIKARNITAICYLALPPKQGGDLGTVFALLSHCSGVLAWNCYKIKSTVCTGSQGLHPRVSMSTRKLFKSL